MRACKKLKANVVSSQRAEVPPSSVKCNFTQVQQVPVARQISEAIHPIYLKLFANSSQHTVCRNRCEFVPNYPFKVITKMVITAPLS